MRAVEAAKNHPRRNSLIDRLWNFRPLLVIGWNRIHSASHLSCRGIYWFFVKGQDVVRIVDGIQIDTNGSLE